MRDLGLLFDISRHLMLAQLSAAAYLSPRGAEGTARINGFPGFQPFAERGTQGFVAANNCHAVMIFRGTEPTEISDILCDVDARRVNATALDGQVHAGFLRGYGWAREAAWRALEAIGAEKLSLTCAGHSLGGAEATLAASEAHLHTSLPVSLSTIGCPRVGDATFAEHLEKQLQGDMERIVFGLDLVTRVPARSQGFKHAGRCVYIDVGGDVHLDPSVWEMFKLRVAGGPTALCQPGIAWAEDHRAQTYVSRLAALRLS